MRVDVCLEGRSIDNASILRGSLIRVLQKFPDQLLLLLLVSL